MQQEDDNDQAVATRRGGKLPVARVRKTTTTEQLRLDEAENSAREPATAGRAMLKEARVLAIFLAVL